MKSNNPVGGYRPGISIDGLHWELWTRREAGNYVKAVFTDLAAQLHCTKQAIQKVITVMEDEGRLVRTPPTRSLYKVVDPAEFVRPEELVE